jgi:hypothetical protein
VGGHKVVVGKFLPHISTHSYSNPCYSRWPLPRVRNLKRMQKTRSWQRFLITSWHVCQGGYGCSTTSHQLQNQTAFLTSYSPSSTSHPHPYTLHLNRSLLADYQQSYSLSHTLASALHLAVDPRTVLLESSSFRSRTRVGSRK